MQSEQISDSINKWLLQQNYYHGFLPREDLPFVLKKKGEFILRSTERPTPKGRRRDVVLSIAWPADPISAITIKDIKNVVIERSPSGMSLDGNRQFPSLEELLTFYRHNALNLLKHSSPIMLAKPVPLAAWEYKHSQILLIKKVGAGAYGEVFKGKIKRGKRTFEAAIKSMKLDATTEGSEKTKEVMAEARLMRMLNHPNIVRIRGIAVLEQPIYIIIDFINGGGLDSYLKKNAKKLTIEEKNKMAISAAWGIEFMHSQDIIHRDIAARNCLFDSKNYVKLSDFGLSRKGSMYKMKEARKMPTKWLAPESLQNFTFYRASDVYTYGILLYEIYTCQEPFKSIGGGEARKRILCGEFLSFAKEAPEELHSMVMSKIFHVDHRKRSPMTEIVKYLEEWLQVELVLEPEENIEDDKFTSSLDSVRRGASTPKMSREPKDSKEGKESKRTKKSKDSGTPKEEEKNKDSRKSDRIKGSRKSGRRKNRAEKTEEPKKTSKEDGPPTRIGAVASSSRSMFKKSRDRETEELKPDGEGKTVEKEVEKQYIELKPVSLEEQKDGKETEKKETVEKSA